MFWTSALPLKSHMRATWPSDPPFCSFPARSAGNDRLGARSNTAASIVNHAMSANSSPVTGVAAASSKRKTLFEGKASPLGVVGVIHPSAKAGISPRLAKGGGEGADMLSIMFPDCDRDVIAEVRMLVESNRPDLNPA
jgi:hypothetical protein